MYTKSRPWYREPWPWLLMAGPALVIMAGIVTVILAVKSDDGLVVDDYYRQGLSINRILAREEKARSMGVKAELQLAPSRDRIRVVLAMRAQAPNRMRLLLAHATQSGQDQVVALAVLSDGSFEGRVRKIGSGPWRATLEDERDGWRLSGYWPTGQDRIEMSDPQ